MNKYISVIPCFSLLFLMSCGSSSSYQETPETVCETYELYEESISFYGHDITIRDITIGSVDVEVDGSSSYISTGSSLEINDVDVTVESIDSSEAFVVITFCVS